LAYGTSSIWRTEEDDIPKNLDEGEFERWLWRKEPVNVGVDVGIDVKVPLYANFRSDQAFPSFEQLPGDNDLDLDFFHSEDGFSYHPRKHWCFLAEIVDTVWIVRLNLHIRDKTGFETRILFHTDDRGKEIDSSMIKNGYTVAVLYAQQHGFLDLSVGIRHENPTAIKVITVWLHLDFRSNRRNRFFLLSCTSY
jgi:hypothetical protein